MLSFKPDWEETKQRYLAWWQGEVIDRCCNEPTFSPPLSRRDSPDYRERSMHQYY